MWNVRYIACNSKVTALVSVIWIPSQGLSSQRSPCTALLGREPWRLHQEFCGGGTGGLGWWCREWTIAEVTCVSCRRLRTAGTAEEMMCCFWCKSRCLKSAGQNGMRMCHTIMVPLWLVKPSVENKRYFKWPHQGDVYKCKKCKKQTIVK